MTKPYGIIPAMVTAFNSDDSVDVGGTKAIAEWLIQQGVHGLAPAGSTSEGAAMNDAERVQVVRATVEQANGRVPVYAGIIHYSTTLAVRLAQECMDAGAAGLMLLVPFYYKPVLEDAFEHFRAVSKAIGKPLMVYNNPWFGGFELTPPQVKQLVDEGVVDSIKAAHGDPMRVSFLKYLCGDKLSAIYGHDYAAFESFVTGGDGWLSAFPNIVPTLAVDLFDAVREKKDLVLARQIWDRIAPIAYYFMYERKGDPQSPHWLAVIKETMAMLGCEAGVPRLPTRPMSDEQRAVLRHYLSMVYPDQGSPVA